MGIDWNSTKPNPELDDLSKSLVREIVEHFLATGTGIDFWETRVALGKDRRLLDALVQKGFVMNIANRLYPRFAALYYLRPDQRTRCEDSEGLSIIVQVSQAATVLAHADLRRDKPVGTGADRSVCCPYRNAICTRFHRLFWQLRQFGRRSCNIGPCFGDHSRLRESRAGLARGTRTSSASSGEDLTSAVNNA